ncbi:MAG: hypothetical protein FWH04_08095 [Oscillospiraceae bacterium]|nr:hypothetical protein [Oscillospiraceae bacterium]
MKKLLEVAGSVCLLMALCLTAGCATPVPEPGPTAAGENQRGNEQDNTRDIVPLPEELQDIADQARNAAVGYGEELGNEWGDRHTELVSSEKREAFEGFNAMRKALQELSAKIEGSRVYAMYPSGDPENVPFHITVDGYPDPADAAPYGKELSWDTEMAQAWMGEAVSYNTAYEKDDDYFISAFAPIYNSDGDVVAILGVDVPAPKAADYPEFVS